MRLSLSDTKLVSTIVKLKFNPKIPMDIADLSTFTVLENYPKSILRECIKDKKDKKDKKNPVYFYIPTIDALVLTAQETNMDIYSINQVIIENLLIFPTINWDDLKLRITCNLNKNYICGNDK